MIAAESAPRYLSENFSFREATFSRTAVKSKIKNLPDHHQLHAMYNTAKGMERVRALCGNYVVSISSWFRSVELNTQLKGSKTSQHLKGEAVDFNIHRFGSPRKICSIIQEHKELIPFDQLILEDGWVHISFNSDPLKKPRYEVLTITPDGKPHTGLVHYK